MFGSKELAPVPDFIADFARANATNPKSDTEGGFLPTGSRNSGMTSLLGSMRREGATGDQMYAAASGLNATLPIPLDDEEIRSIAYGLERYDPSEGQKLTEQYFARHFADEYAGRLAFNAAFEWLFYTDGIWAEDQKGLLAQESAKELTWRRVERFEEMAKNSSSDDEAKQFRKAAKTIQRAAFIKSVTKLATSDPQIHIPHDKFDQEDTYLNLANATYDLANHEVLDHTPEHHLTLQANVSHDPEADCPHFDRFLEQILPGKLGEYVLRAFAYALLGTGKEQCLFVMVGDGRNGKTTLVNVMQNLMGGYAVVTDPSTLLAKTRNSINNDIARLRGKRTIFTSELPPGSALDEAQIKRLTGNEIMTARFLHKEYFEFSARGVIFMATNHLPVINGSDFALTRRIWVLRFPVKIEKEDVDSDLENKLLAEKPGILNRLLSSLKDYQVNGLNEPVEVITSTQSYAKNSDSIALFIEEGCKVGKDVEVGAQVLFAAYQQYCSGCGTEPLSINLFKELVRAKGFSQKRKRSGHVWKEITIKL